MQPISFLPFIYDPVSNDPLFPYTWTDSYGATKDVYLVPLDAECNIPDPYAETWGEAAAVIDSGRLNLARTTQYVIDAAYEEALTTINTANAIALDPAGRLLLDLPDGTAKIIDAPRENLALYQRLMKDGCLSPGVTGIALAPTTIGKLQANLGYLVCDDTLAQKTKTTADLLRAASFLSGAADKFGHIGVDEVIYINSTLGINNVVVNPADGTMTVQGYFNFLDMSYNRNIYDETKADLLQPVTVSADIYPAQFDVAWDMLISPEVFLPGGWNGELLDAPMPVVNFTRAADDALSVIYYIHNYELPVIVAPVQ